MVALGACRFGGFVLNRSRGCLEDRAGAERFLRPKSYRVLEMLCERRGQLVSKDELILTVWPNVIASDDSLAQCVSEIRRALGPEGADLLRTVPRRGYMLAAQDTGAEAAISRKWIWRPGFAQASGLAALTAIAAAVAWWTMPGDAPEPTAKFADATLFQADALLEARDWRRREDNERARALLQKVVADQPGNAEAWASLGLTYWQEVQHLAWGGGRREMTLALEMVERALTLGDSSRSHRLLAEMRLLAPFPEMRSPLDALANARAAVSLAPNEPDNLAVLAQVLALTGRAAEALEIIERALRYDRTPPDWHRQVAGLSYLLAGEPARATEELGPLYGAGTFASKRWWPGWLFAASLAHAGRSEQAAMVIRAAQERRPERSIAAVAQSLDGFADRVGLGLVLDGLRIAGMPG
ncbi:winged helix-turn-helix domain-containing protein [Aurantimonas coralicida]|uniref:winged helix-turn-helix domain-containing protein n=1 Tax=Aurantimonas coralicida TaxID=182270 RepID=UPI001E33092E|nr:winged helix-turn-helix domain-containing protein [Aurantimonas coralicida]MCD1644130.1 winged helix-turn-helix domain-containing protein [Aurantimonas coralicida]